MTTGLANWRARVLAVTRPLTLWLASMLLAANVLAILYGVSTRYWLGGAPIWVDELSRYLIIATVMLAAGAVWVEGAHMRVALVERWLPPPWARVLVIYQWLLTLLLAVGATWLSWHYALSASYFTTMGLGISRSIPLMAMPVGFALLAWQVLWYGPRPLPVGYAEDAA